MNMMLPAHLSEYTNRIMGFATAARPAITANITKQAVVMNRRSISFARFGSS